MRSAIFLLTVVSAGLFIFSCNNSGDSNSSGKLPRSAADSLYDDVMDGHNEGMAKMGRLTRAEQATTRLIDSLSKLPAKAREAAAPLKARLDSLQKDLSYAEFAMDKWMEELNLDSAKNDLKQRVEYLQSEKSKVFKVRDAINSSLQKADSLLRNRF